MIEYFPPTSHIIITKFFYNYSNQPSFNPMYKGLYKHFEKQNNFAFTKLHQDNLMIRGYLIKLLATPF